jgi:hypothetical protein
MTENPEKKELEPEELEESEGELIPDREEMAIVDLGEPPYFAVDPPPVD